VNLTATILDYAALGGIAIAVLYTIVRASDFCKRPEGFIALAFVVSVAAISHPEVWVDAYAFARVFSPLILVAGLDALSTRSYAGFLPLLLIAPRVGLPIASQMGQAMGNLMQF